MDPALHDQIGNSKILYIHKTGPSWGGAQQGVYSLIRQFCSEFRNTIFVCNHGLLFDKVQTLPVKSYYLPIGSVCLFPITLVALAVILMIEKPDIVHSNHRYATFLVQVVRKIFALKFQILHTARSIFNDKTSFYLGDYNIAITEAVRHNLIEEFHLPADRVEVIYNGIELNHSDANQQPNHIGIESFDQNGKICISSIGSLVPIKGHQYLIQAIARLPRETQDRLMVLIAGDGPLRHRLERQVEQFGLSHVIKFLGYRSDIAQILQRCQFNVVTSHQEGHCRVIIEAFRVGRPSIAFQLDYVMESIQPNRSGLLVPLHDVDALAKAIQFYVDHPEIVKEHGRYGQQWANDKFSLNAMFDQYRAVYLKLLNTNLKSTRTNR